MKAIITGSGNAKEAEQQLRRFIAKFEPKHQTLIRAVRKALRKRFPTAQELVYDYDNFLVIGYSATERGSDSIVSISAGASGLRLFFINGPKLLDPKKVLLGSGKQTRFIRLESVQVLTRPEVQALIAAALARAKFPLRETGRGKLVIKSISAKQKQRPRRGP
jgi:hypothetical protein